jgi:hypothetical protein
MGERTRLSPWLETPLEFAIAFGSTEGMEELAFSFFPFSQFPFSYTDCGRRFFSDFR